MLILPVLASQLAGCIGSPRYARYSDPQGSASVGLNEPVEYRINAQVVDSYPGCVAILPLAVSEEAQAAIELPDSDDMTSGADEESEPHVYQRYLNADDKQRLVRRMLYGFVSPYPPRDIELARIDRLVKQSPPYSRADQQRLGQQLKCGYLLQGTITQFDTDYLGLYSNIHIGVELSLVHATSGRVLWSGRHVAQSRDGAVPLSPVGLAMGAVMAAANLEPDQLEGVAADLARRLVRTMPLEKDNVFLLAARRRHVYEVATKRLNLRVGPGTHYDVRRVLQDNQKLAMLDAPAQGWCKVKTSDGETGFVAIRYLRESPTSRGS